MDYTDKINPYNVPTRKLYTGAHVPAVGLGTFGSDKYGPDVIAEAVLGAAEAGFRHFDCAACYGNQKEVGASLAKAMRDVPREEFFITSKLWNDMHGYMNAMRSCEQTLEELGLEYLDLYLIHWPFPNFHPPGCPEDYHNPDARPYIHEEFMDTWRALEELVHMGKLKHIGTSNMSLVKLEMLLRDSDVRPAANEMELHPTFQQKMLFDFCQNEEILPIGYCPLGSPSRPARDRTPEDASDMEHPVVTAIARERGIHPAEVCIRWQATRGSVPIPFSVKPTQYLANIKAVMADPLTDEEMKRLETCECGNRLIKGQVFLWREGQNWRDLWDENGMIAT